MNLKSFICGMVVGVILTIAAAYVIALSSVENRKEEKDDPIHYLEQPVSYENKSESSFKVIQVLGNAALANEASDKIDEDVMYYGNTVLVLGENFYTDQIVNIKNPKRVGTYSYTSKSERPMTVPVIDGEFVE